MAGFALIKSVAYNCFFDKALIMSRQMPTGGLFSVFASHFAQPAQNATTDSP
jgi:hypothetical protein